MCLYVYVSQWQNVFFKTPSVTVQRHLNTLTGVYMSADEFSLHKSIKKSNCKKLQKLCALHALASEY